jgi:hypothetical protein
MNHIKFFIFLAFIASFLLGCAGKYGYGPEVELNKTRVIDNFGQEIGKKYGMKLIAFRFVTNSPLERYGMSFISNKKVTLEEGQQLARAIYKEFLNVLTNNPVIDAYIAEASKQIPSLDWIPSKKTLGFKITYWDEKVDRQFPPHLAAIVFCEGTFNYYQADPETQKLHLVFSDRVF